MMSTTREAPFAARAATAVLALAEDIASTATSIRSRVRGTDTGTVEQEIADPAVAACALFLEVAYADQRYSERERWLVESTLQREFGLSPVRANLLVRAAERARARAAGVWVFTGVLVNAYGEAQREAIADILHRLVHVDGAPDWHEHYQVRKIYSLLRVEPTHV